MTDANLEPMNCGIALPLMRFHCSLHALAHSRSIVCCGLRFPIFALPSPGVLYHISSLYVKPFGRTYGFQKSGDDVTPQPWDGGVTAPQTHARAPRVLIIQNSVALSQNCLEVRIGV